jgi:hypothetical protein
MTKLGFGLADVKYHMPTIRLPDTLGGAAVGALGGLGTYGLSRAMTPDDSKDQPSLATHLGVGAAAGAGIGNLVGDRARRYLANNLMPYEYQSTARKSHGEMLRPRSLQHVWDTMILDKPDTQMTDMLRNEMRKPQFGIDSRRELLRRHLNLPVREGTEIFESTGMKPFTPSFKPNGKPLSGGIPGTYEHLQLKPDALSRYPDSDRIVEDTHTTPNDPWSEILARHGTQQMGDKTRIFDHWDFGLSPEERNVGWDYLKRTATGDPGMQEPIPFSQLRTWRRDQTVDDFAGRTRMDHLKTLLQRYLLNDILGTGGVVFDQTFSKTGMEAAVNQKPAKAPRERRAMGGKFVGRGKSTPAKTALTKMSTRLDLPDLDQVTQQMQNISPQILAKMYGVQGLGAASGGAIPGIGFGTLFGAADGSDRGDMLEGAARGAIRGGGTALGGGLGFGLGGAAGALLGGAAGGGMEGARAGGQIGSLLGTGLGALTGYAGTGAMLGPPSPAKTALCKMGLMEDTK